MNQDTTINALIDQLTADMGLALKQASGHDRLVRNEQITKAQNVAHILTTIEEINYTIDHLMLSIRERRKLPLLSR